MVPPTRNACKRNESYELLDQFQQNRGGGSGSDASIRSVPD